MISSIGAPLQTLGAPNTPLWIVHSEYATTNILRRVELHLYTFCRKAFGEYFDIQIVIDYEMKLIIYYIFIF